MSLIKQHSVISSATFNKHCFASRKANMATKAIWFDTDPKLHLTVHKWSLGGPARCPAVLGIPSSMVLQQKRLVRSGVIPWWLAWAATAWHLPISAGHLRPPGFIQPNLNKWKTAIGRKVCNASKVSNTVDNQCKTIVAWKLKVM